MPDYVYVGDEGRYYALPAPANAPVVGDTYDLPEAPPDGRWEPVPPSASKPKRDVPSDPPPADPAPAGDTTTNQE